MRLLKGLDKLRLWFLNEAYFRTPFMAPRMKMGGLMVLTSRISGVFVGSATKLIYRAWDSRIARLSGQFLSNRSLSSSINAIICMHHGC